MILTGGMAHPRKLVRQAVVALLTAANTAAETRVSGTRVEPNKKTALPAISVYTLTDSVDQDVKKPLEDSHVIDLEIAGWVAHKDSAPGDDAMDDLAEQIEAAMVATTATGSYLGGTASEVRLLGTEMQMVEDDGRSDPLVGIVVLKYEITYYADLTTTAVADDFLTDDAKFPLVGGVVDTLIPEDTFTVQEP